MSSQQKQEIKEAIQPFLDVASTATARATFYNTRKEQERIIQKVHNRLFSIERGIYSLALTLPGITDISRRTGVLLLLSQQGNGLLTDEIESAIIERILSEFPPQKRFNLFLELKKKRVNNSRTRKLILRNIIASRKLELWAVKYRQKLRQSLKHVFGERKTSILHSILAKNKSERNEKEKRILDSNIGRYVNDNQNISKVYECIGFILGNEKNITLQMLSAYIGAKSDIKKGIKLPYEVLEGIRSCYHSQVPSSHVLEMTKQRLTTGQRIALQEKAQRDNVEVKFNPADYDAIRLYVYAFKRGMTPEIANALKQKALEKSHLLYKALGKIGILIDNSQSMKGSETQFMRPVSVALATRDFLVAASEEAKVLYTNVWKTEDDLLPDIQGDTSLSRGLIELLETDVQSVFILSDGYENAPAGRTNEVLHLARKLGIEKPVFQLNPVIAAEAGGIKKLSKDIPAISVSAPETVFTALMREILKIDIEKGMTLMLKQVSNQLTV